MSLKCNLVSFYAESKPCPNNQLFSMSAVYLLQSWGFCHIVHVTCIGLYDKTIWLYGYNILYIYNNNQNCDSPVSASHILVLQVCAISPSSPLAFAGNTSVFETRSPRCRGVYKLGIETGLDTARETKEVFISEANAKIHGDKSTMQSRVLILKI